MKKQTVWLLFIIAVLLATALSVGSAVFLMLAVLLFLVLMLSLISVLLTAKRLKAEVLLEENRVYRGENVKLQITVLSNTHFPAAPISVTVYSMTGTQEIKLRLQSADGRKRSTSTVLHCSHIGVFHPGVAHCIVQDCFGLFFRKVFNFPQGPELIVLPQNFDIEELTYATGDHGMETLSRATEDITDPSDFRTYMPGDPMKKIHWKLSMRKQELVVRRFEQPALPDAMVLMDCAEPEGDTIGDRMDLQDAMLETAASVMNAAGEGHLIRLPLMGEHPIQLISGMGLPLVLESLARMTFSETEEFERVLMIEAGNMSRIGCLVLIVNRMSAQLTEAIRQIRRIGPVIRLYMITPNPEDEVLMSYVMHLQNAGVEVSYVTPYIC